MRRYGIRGISAITAAAVMMMAAQPALAGAFDGFDEYLPESGYEYSAAMGGSGLSPFTDDTGLIYYIASRAADEKSAKHTAEIAKDAAADSILMSRPYPFGWLSYKLGQMIASWMSK